MDYSLIQKMVYEKIVCMAKLKIYVISNKLYELYNKWLGAYEIKDNVRMEILYKEIMLTELHEYQKANNVKC